MNCDLRGGLRHELTGVVVAKDGLPRFARNDAARLGGAGVFCCFFSKKQICAA